TLAGMQLLGVVYGAQGDYARAERLLRETLRLQRKIPGKEFPWIYTLRSLGGSLLKQQQYGDAEELLREFLDMYEPKDPGAWTTFNVKSMLGGALLGQKKYADAEPL